ncbi:MAG: glutamate--tRNA ligase [Bacilli bacterium]
MYMKVRTRFAPSPTGYMHIGNLRSALFAYLTAKSMGGDFLLRIEDTDQARKVEGATEFIYNTLKLCNIVPDEGAGIGGEYGPYFQSERLDIYKHYADILLEKNEAYYCFCTEERLNGLREVANKKKKPFMYDGHCSYLDRDVIEEKLKNGEPYVIRQKMPHEGFTSYNDTVYGEIKVENCNLEDQILIKSDGYPTYNFANVIDDHLMEITHVNRGNEYLSSTPKYLLLYKAFGWESPTYIHQPLVIKEDGTKISKRNKDDNLMDLINRGFLPDAIINYLALLGWSPKENKEIFSLKELEENFDINRISSSPSCYDIKKLIWFNHHYISVMEDTKYLEWIKKYFNHEVENKSEEWINTLLMVYKNQVSYGSEINELTDVFFQNEININDECKEFLESDDSISKVIEEYRKEIKELKEWNIESIKDLIMNVKEVTGVKGKLLYMPIRIMVSGVMHGPELPDTIYLIGKEKVLERLN